MAEIDFYDKEYDRYETIELISTNTAVPDSRIYKLRANNDYCALAIPSDYRTDYIYQDVKNIEPDTCSNNNYSLRTIYQFSVNIDNTDIYRLYGDVKIKGEYHGAPDRWWNSTFYVVYSQETINQMSKLGGDFRMTSMPGYSYIDISNSRDGTITRTNQAINCHNCSSPAWYRYDIQLLLEARTEPYTFYIVSWHNSSRKDWTKCNYITPLTVNLGHQFADKDLKRSSVKFMVKNVEYTVLKNSSNVFS